MVTGITLILVGSGLGSILSTSLSVHSIVLSLSLTIHIFLLNPSIISVGILDPGLLSMKDRFGKFKK